ncbi:MAG TPA: hypothetical protein VIY48_05040 [Candidatus Paceibacterota bacterium]
MYRIAISKFRDGIAYDEVFRFKIENESDLRNDIQVLRFVKNHCRLGYSVCVDPQSLTEDRAFISYRSHEGAPFKKITFYPGGAAQTTTEIPWEQL